MMDDGCVAEVIANRDEPIPVISVNKNDTRSHRHGRSESLQDKLFAKFVPSCRCYGGKRGAQWTNFVDVRLLEQVIPAGDVDNESVSGGDKRTIADVKRPAFSLPLMANNFRRFNAR
jgi:hypothetical protein